MMQFGKNASGFSEKTEKLYFFYAFSGMQDCGTGFFRIRRYINMYFSSQITIIFTIERGHENF